jgi:multidrug efflux pump subunit AcrA (membrane-fusion protein)
MEGVSTVMPLTVRTGARILASALLEGGKGGGGSGAAEARAQAAEAQARRQAEAEVRGTRQQVQELRESGQHKSASARVAAANSGLTLSGSSLLNLTALEDGSEERVDRVLGESALRVQSLLDSGAEQARSIRLSGRGSGGRDAGLGSLLRLGSQSLGQW